MVTHRGCEALVDDIRVASSVEEALGHLAPTAEGTASDGHQRYQHLAR